MYVIQDGEDPAACRARGCGGTLRAVEAFIEDGAYHCCTSCGRGHTFHVATDDGPISVEIDRAPRKP